MSPHRYDNGEAYARVRVAVQAHGLRHTKEAATIEGVEVRNVYTGPGSGAAHGLGSHRAWIVAGVKVEPAGDISFVVEAIIEAAQRAG